MGVLAFPKLLTEDKSYENEPRLRVGDLTRPGQVARRIIISKASIDILRMPGPKYLVAGSRSKKAGKKPGNINTYTTNQAHAACIYKADMDT